MLRTPTQKSTKEDTWKQLVTDYKLDNKMYALLMTTTMDDLEDLRFYWQSETEIKQFVDRLDGVTDDVKRLQCSRLCRVWHNYCQWATTRDAGKSHQSTAELDDLRIVCSCDEKTIAQLRGGDANDNPLESTAWLARFLAAHGAALQAGQVILTGTYAGLLPVRPGERWSSKFGNLAEVELCVR